MSKPKRRALTTTEDLLKLSLRKREALLQKCFDEPLFFGEMFFECRLGEVLDITWYMRYFETVVKRVVVLDPNYRNIVVNQPPGSSKSIYWHVIFPLWATFRNYVLGLPIRWLGTSYSDTLVMGFSATVRDTIRSDFGKLLFPELTISTTNSSKNKWEYLRKDIPVTYWTAFSTSGQLTGSRAGMIGYGEDEFTGAIIIDDPQKPADADSLALIEASNKKINTVVSNRKMCDETPAIMVQQRIGSNDASNFINSDKSAIKGITNIVIPAVVNSETEELMSGEVLAAFKEYNPTYDGSDFSFWGKKMSVESLNDLCNADKQYFYTQYQQNPDEFEDGSRLYKSYINAERIIELDVDKNLTVSTFWDLGLTDNTIILFVQLYKDEVRIVDCRAGNNQKPSDYIAVVQEFKRMYNVEFDEHVAPHDVKAKSVQTGKTTKDVYKEEGLEFSKVVKVIKDKSVGVNAVRELLPKVYICKNRCQTLIKALKIAHRPYDSAEKVYKGDIKPKWATDYCDALQTLALFLQKDRVVLKPKTTNDGSWMSV